MISPQSFISVIATTFLCSCQCCAALSVNRNICVKTPKQLPVNEHDKLAGSDFMYSHVKKKVHPYSFHWN